jgi:hypothetical protein
MLTEEANPGCVDVAPMSLRGFGHPCSGSINPHDGLGTGTAIPTAMRGSLSWIANANNLGLNATSPPVVVGIHRVQRMQHMMTRVNNKKPEN